MYNLGHVVCQKYRAKSAGGWFLLAVYSMYSFLYSESELNWIESEEKPVMLQAWLGVTQLAKILKKNEIAFLVVFQKLFWLVQQKIFEGNNSLPNGMAKIKKMLILAFGLRHGSAKVDFLTHCVEKIPACNFCFPL